jgi:hypothetical protein
MTPRDYEQLQRIAPALRSVGTLGVFSPIKDGEIMLFPDAARLPRWRHDLNRPLTRRYDVLLAANVFMYSPDPVLWFRHVLASCKYFVLLDLIRRRRSPNDELGRDGDSVRFGVGNEVPRIGRHLDLNSMEDRLLGYHVFQGGASNYDEYPIHVLALFRGDLADPVLRIDDYPTGVRPILQDMGPLHAILETIDAVGLEYHLGIVPALLDVHMGRFLSRLQHMVPAAHGYDHRYPECARSLEAANDPYNERDTVGAFDEFRGRSYEDILTRLSESRTILQDHLGIPVTTYIPPCNRAGRKTGRALVEAGYTHYLSERRIAGCTLPWIRSDFYGRSAEFTPAQEPSVSALHLPWEWDLTRLGHADSLAGMLTHLLNQREQERERGRRLGALVSGKGAH